MKEVIATARNIFYHRSDEGEYLPSIEAIITLTEPTFRVDAIGEFIRERALETVRFTTSVQGLRNMAKSFIEWADDAEKEAEPKA